MSEELIKPQGPAETTAFLSDELRAAAEEMEEAARRAGVEPDTALGPWVRSMALMMRHNADVFEWHGKLVVGTYEQFMAASKAELDRLKAATAASEAQCRKVEATVGTIDIRTHDLMTRVIEGMASEVADKLRERMVIVEHRHNRMVLWRRGALIAAVLLSTLGGGYVWRAYDDGQATDLLERCLTNPVQDQHTGQLYCQFKASKP